MKLPKGIVATAVGVLGGLQAWDSGVFGAGPAVIALACLGIAIPAIAALATANRGTLALAVLVSAVLEVTARLISPIPLPELVLVSWMAAILLLLPGLVSSPRAGSPSAAR